MSGEITHNCAVEESDDEIMQEVMAGDSGMFRVLVERYYGRIFATSYRYLDNYHDAQDATQETFTRAFASAAYFRTGGSVYRWLLRIAVNLCLNEMKSARRRLAGALEEEMSAQEGTEENVRLKRMEREIRQAIQGLPETQRMAVVLSKFEGLSYADIAQVMGRSVPAVESLLVRARRTLLKRLAEYIDAR